jgi:hypothetical protein
MPGKKKTVGERQNLLCAIDAVSALRIAFEDSETSDFIKTNFSNPEKRPEIITHKWISRRDSGFRWKVEIIEKAPPACPGARKIINIAVVEIDASTGNIVGRKYFKNILLNEYVRYRIESE